MKLKTKKILFNLALASTLFITTGCAKKFDYKTGDNGEIVAEGYINFDYIKECYLLEIRNLNNENKLFICTLHGKPFYEEYIDIRTDKVIYNRNSSIEMANKAGILDYLITYDEIKNKYSMDDIDRILEKIAKDYEFDTEKTKVKSGE